MLNVSTTKSQDERGVGYPATCAAAALNPTVHPKGIYAAALGCKAAEINSKETTMKTRKELMAELVQIQNGIDHQDILTITAFMNDEQLAAHVEGYRNRAARKAVA